MQIDEKHVWAADDDWISVSSLFSEESNFYGDSPTRRQSEIRVATYDPMNFWVIQKWNMQRIRAEAATEGSLVGNERSREETGPPGRLHGPEHGHEASRPFNPYEGISTAKQLEESLDDFLTRLPPSATTIATGPWIWLANPASEYRPLNEDIAGFSRQGADLLEGYLSRKSELEHQNPGKAAAGITRMLTKERIELEHDIDALAKRHKVVCGKWMLFPTTEHVDQVWAIVAKHTLHGKLGCSAKVSTVDTTKKSENGHLVCIYTNDYSDMADVKRVLKELKQLGLAEDNFANTKKRPIYYKCDAYTYLDISSGNEFNIRASLYSSKDLFMEMKKEGTFF